MHRVVSLRTRNFHVLANVYNIPRSTSWRWSWSWSRWWWRLRSTSIKLSHLPVNVTVGPSIYPSWSSSSPSASFLFDRSLKENCDFDLAADLCLLRLCRVVLVLVVGSRWGMLLAIKLNKPCIVCCSLCFGNQWDRMCVDGNVVVVLASVTISCFLLFEVVLHMSGRYKKSYVITAWSFPSPPGRLLLAAWILAWPVTLSNFPRQHQQQQAKSYLVNLNIDHGQNDGRKRRIKY